MDGRVEWVLAVSWSTLWTNSDTLYFAWPRVNHVGERTIFESRLTPLHSPPAQTATFTWSYKNTDDRTKIEVWDVVDRVLSDEKELGAVDDDDAPAGACA